MKTTILFFFALLFVQVIVAQPTIKLHTRSGVSSFPLSQVDSITFTAQGPVPIDSLVAYFPFNGNANDSSGRGNNGSTHGGISWVSDRFGNAGRAISLNGTGWVHIPSSPSLDIKSDITIAGWIKATSLTGVQMLVYRGDARSGYDPYFFRLEDSVLIFYRAPTQAASEHVQTTISDLNMSNFHMVVARYQHDNGSMSIYVDGVLRVNELHPATISYATSNMYNDIGGVDNSASQGWHGAIDDLRIYRRALSDLEIQSLFHEGGR
jgi:hypothetical protein